MTEDRRRIPNAPKFTCPDCQSAISSVKRGEWTKDGYRRVRECRSCGTRFSSIEIVERRLRKYAA